MNMPKIEDRINQLLEDIGPLPDWEDRYKRLIEWGKKLALYPEEFRDEKFKVKGCQSQVWLKPELREGRVYFFADSDAVLVKGIVSLLVHVYSGATPTEILQTKPDFLAKLGITEHLSMNRTNGLQSMLKQIQYYALAYAKLGG
jgi:cysteine desulfuration protein SufE